MIKQKQVIRVQSKKDKKKDEGIEKLKQGFRNNPSSLEDYFEAISLQIQYPYDVLEEDEPLENSNSDDDSDEELPTLAVEQPSPELEDPEIMSSPDTNQLSFDEEHGRNQESQLNRELPSESNKRKFSIDSKFNIGTG